MSDPPERVPPGTPDNSERSPSEWSRRELLQLASGAFASLAFTDARPESLMSESDLNPTERVAVRLTVNGREQRLDLDPRTSLLDALREHLGLPGTKKGCNQGACGACTVLIDGKRILSCLSLVAMHDGASITTVEGLAQNDQLHPLQAAFVEHDAFQCGYCTPGQIMSGIGCIAEGHAGSPEQIQFWMSGNICRCGAYPGIVAAIGAAAGRTSG